jgi:hemerythrin-like domain-containing protein
MKRDPALAGLSREHQEALVLARRAALPDPGAEDAARLCEQLLHRWDAQFEPHFAVEESVLLPALANAGEASAAREAQRQHDTLRALTARVRAGEHAALPAWGMAMRVHVRFEERELFPLAERVVDLERLGAALHPGATTAEHAGA